MCLCGPKSARRCVSEGHFSESKVSSSEEDFAQQAVGDDMSMAIPGLKGQRVQPTTSPFSSYLEVATTFNYSTSYDKKLLLLVLLPQTYNYKLQLASWPATINVHVLVPLLRLQLQLGHYDNICQRTVCNGTCWYNYKCEHTFYNMYS